MGIIRFLRGKIINYFLSKADIGTVVSRVHDKDEARVLKVSAGAGSIDGSTGDRFGAMCNSLPLLRWPPCQSMRQSLSLLGQVSLHGGPGRFHTTRSKLDHVASVGSCPRVYRTGL
jgi:hypothetical protein